MKLSLFLFSLALVLSAASSPLPARAHLAAGEDVELQGYLIDFGFSPKRITVQEDSVMAFELKREDGVPQPFDQLWLTVTHDGRETLAATLSPDSPGKTSIKSQFPEAGTYDVTARFTTGMEGTPEELVSHTFQISVEDAPAEAPPAAASPSTTPIIVILIATNLILFLYIVLRDRRH